MSTTTIHILILIAMVIISIILGILIAFKMVSNACPVIGEIRYADEVEHSIYVELDENLMADGGLQNLMSHYNLVMLKIESRK